MPVWKQVLLSLYYYGTVPARTRQNVELRACGQAPVIVFFYHRISDQRPNAWTASNAMFTRQIAWLKRHFQLVSLGEAQRRVQSGTNRHPCVAITFDDGYADNCEHALPLLIAERIPCTYFVSSRHIITGTPFPHDLAQGRPLAPNTTQQIRELAQAGIEIGSHTRTHADVGRVKDPALLYDEMVRSREELQELTGSPVRYFAFPYGQHSNLSSAAFALAREAGYEAVCSAYGGFNFPGDDAFHLQRIHADGNMIQLKNWATLDPRKLKSIQRYDYQPQPCEVVAEREEAFA